MNVTSTVSQRAGLVGLLENLFESPMVPTIDPGNAAFMVTGAVTGAGGNCGAAGAC